MAAMSTPNNLNTVMLPTPALSQSIRRFNAVWPPMRWASTASMGVSPESLWCIFFQRTEINIVCVYLIGHGGGRVACWWALPRCLLREGDCGLRAGIIKLKTAWPMTMVLPIIGTTDASISGHLGFKRANSGWKTCLARLWQTGERKK